MSHPVAFVDLDGVLCDFVAGALALHGKSLPPREVSWDFCAQIGFRGVDDPAFWAPLTRQFWADLDWTAEGRELFAAVESTFGADNVALLSSPCDVDGCADGKRDWVRRHLPAYRRRLFLGSAKHLFAGPGKLLIDDHEPHVEAFISAGGRALLVPRPWNAARGRTDSRGRFDAADFASSVFARHQQMREAP